MKTIKIIDLLNKIANGEEVPKKIKWNDDEWHYQNDASKNYFTDYEDLFTVIDGANLNDNVEILEEKPKHIEEIKDDNSIWEEQAKDIDYIFKNKINEIMKAVNYLLNKEER